MASKDESPPGEEKPDQDQPEHPQTGPELDQGEAGPGSLFSHVQTGAALAAGAPAAVPEAVTDTVAAAGGFGLLFQAPDLSDIPPPPRRRAPVAAKDQDEPASARSGKDEATGQAGDTDAQRGQVSSEEDDEGDGKRRRRRGGKGRRGRGTEQEGEDSGDPQGQQQERQQRGQQQGQSGAGAPQEDTGSGSEGEGESSKRRRRRSRTGESGERSTRDTVTGIRGSTRLEAKRLRRREGRESGRRRTVITESEFLARRESVERVMVVRGTQERTQIGVLEDGVLVEHYVSRETQATMVGNVYLGRVQNVLPSMEAAFVDIGKGRNAVLYAGEVNWDAAGLDNEPRRIENALSSGESVLAQVTKDPIGHKGSRLTSQVSLPGRFLVYVPGNAMTGISRKLPDNERARLKGILKEIVPAEAGVIVRTAAEGASEEDLRADVERLTAMWDKIQAKQAKASAPALLHGEPDMTVRVIRDVFNEDFAKVVVSGDTAWREVNDYVASVAPDLAQRVEKWTDEQDVFAHFRVSEALAKAMDRKVWLPSGGSLVIDRTEAMTVVDVNTGKFVGSGGNLEETVTKNNIEAAEEVVRQLRLRDIGGIIVIDFIDMVLESNRDLVVRRLLECLGRDRTKHQVAEVTSLGLVQMTRKRVGSGLVEVFSEPCTQCGGRGILVHPEPVDRPGGDEGGGGDRSRRESSKGRRGRASTAASGGGSAVAKNVLPPPNPNGPTPAQIAAAAHGAAVASSNGNQAGGEAATAEATAAQPAPTQPAPSVAASTEPAPSEPAPADPAPRPRRRRGRVVAPAGPPTGQE